MSGGAWKVAYADFVTAMMALFMVLWISSQEKEILIATSQYFQNPFRSPMDASSGVMPFNSNRTTQNDKKESGSGQQDRSKQIQLTFLSSVASDFYRLLNLDENLAGKPIDVQVTTDGLRVTLFDRANRPFFKGDTAELTEWGTFVIQSLSWTIDRHRFHVTIEGHTKAGMKFKNEGYSAWELSTDRANATRRALVHYAVDPELINRVTGFADTKPVADEPPTSESHHRVTLSLALSAKKATEPPAKEKPEIKAAAPPAANPAANAAHAPEPREFRAASPSVSPPKKSAP